MSNILPNDSSKMSHTKKLIVSKKFDNLAKITLRVTETGPSRIQPGIYAECPYFITFNNNSKLTTKIRLSNNSFEFIN